MYTPWKFNDFVKLFFFFQNPLFFIYLTMFDCFLFLESERKHIYFFLNRFDQQLKKPSLELTESSTLCFPRLDWISRWKNLIDVLCFCTRILILYKVKSSKFNQPGKFYQLLKTSADFCSSSPKQFSEHTLPIIRICFQTKTPSKFSSLSCLISSLLQLTRLVQNLLDFGKMQILKIGEFGRVD